MSHFSHRRFNVEYSLVLIIYASYPLAVTLLVDNELQILEMVQKSPSGDVCCVELVDKLTGKQWGE